MNERQRQAQAALAADLDNEPESMTEAAQKIYAERRRKEERAKRKAEEKKQRIYRTLMRKAGITSRKKHLDHIKDSTASDRMPHGAVSDDIYQNLIKARKFDQYNRPNNKQGLSKEEMKLKEVKDSLGALAAQLSPDKKDGQGKTFKPLVTPKWVIGYK